MSSGSDISFLLLVVFDICMLLAVCLMHGLLLLKHFYFLHDLPFFLLRLVLYCMHAYCIGGQRSKSLESCKGEEKKERRISWGVNGTDNRRSLGKRRFSEELKRRRHTVAGDMR